MMRWSDYDTYDGWKQRNRFVRKGQKHCLRSENGAAMFHIDQTQANSVSDQQIWEYLTQEYKDQLRKRSFASAFPDPSAERDAEALAKRLSANKQHEPEPKGSQERPMCPLLLVTPMPNAWGK